MSWKDRPHISTPGLLPNPGRPAGRPRPRRTARNPAKRREAAAQPHTEPLEPAPTRASGRRRRPLSPAAQQTTGALKAKALGLPAGYGRIIAAAHLLHPV